MAFAPNVIHLRAFDLTHPWAIARLCSEVERLDKPTIGHRHRLQTHSLQRTSGRRCASLSLDLLADYSLAYTFYWRKGCGLMRIPLPSCSWLWSFFFCLFDRLGRCSSVWSSSSGDGGYKEMAAPEHPQVKRWFCLVVSCLLSSVLVWRGLRAIFLVLTSFFSCTLLSACSCCERE